MSGNRTGVADQPIIPVTEQPHGSHPSMAPAPIVAEVEGHSGGRPRSLRVLAARVGRFLLHLLEMLLAMMLGMGLFNVVLVDEVLERQMGYRLYSSSDPYLIGMAVFMVIPMVAWMRFRGMAWHPIAEMSAAMVLLAVLLIGGEWLGILARSELNLLEHVLMLPVMLIAMLFRLGHYTGSHATHRAHAA